VKTKFIFLTVIFVFCLQVPATNKDSLLKIIQSPTSHDSAKYNAYYELGWEYLYSNPDSTYLLGKKAYLLVKKMNNKKAQSKILNMLGAYSQVKAEYLKAVEYYQQSLKIGEQLNDDDAMLIANGNIGALYLTIGQPKKALAYQLKSLAIAEKLNKKDHLASIYNNLSQIYNTDKEYKKGVDYGNKSFNIYNGIGDKNGISSAAGNIGNAYEGLKNYGKALEFFQLCYNTSVEAGNVYEEVHSLLDIGKIYQEKKNYKEAIKYLTKAKISAEDNEDYPGLRGAYSGLYETYKILGDKDKALENYEMFVNATDLISREKKQEEINKRIIEFEFNKRAVSDSIRNAEENKYKDAILKANKTQIEKDKILQIALTVGLIFFIGFGILIFNRFRITAKQKQIIELKNKQTEEQKLIIEEKQKEILDSINYAKRIQDSLLDNFDSVGKFFSDSFLLIKPKDIVSGDFYWLSKKTFNEPALGGGSVVKELFFIAICDSTGHGVPGGFMSLLNTAYLSEAINEKGIYQPNKIFDYVRSRLINTISKNDQKDGFDGVLMCFEKKFTFENKKVIKTETLLSYAAAYNAPILIRNNELIKLGADKMPVGYGEKIQSFTLFSYPISENDLLYIYTDGYADQFGGPIAQPNPAKPKSFGLGKKFQYKQLEDLILKTSDMALSSQKELLNQKFEAWKGDLEQIDDVCIIGIKI